MSELIDPDALCARLDAGPPPTIIDVRDPAEYAAGHLPGARNIPAAELHGRLAEVPRGRPVVPYCTMRHRGSSRSERAAALLRAGGYQAQALDGGFPAWAAEGHAVARDSGADRGKGADGQRG